MFAFFNINIFTRFMRDFLAVLFPAVSWFTFFSASRFAFLLFLSLTLLFVFCCTLLFLLIDAFFFVNGFTFIFVDMRTLLFFHWLACFGVIVTAFTFFKQAKKEWCRTSIRFCFN